MKKDDYLAEIAGPGKIDYFAICYHRGKKVEGLRRVETEADVIRLKKKARRFEIGRWNLPALLLDYSLRVGIGEKDCCLAEMEAVDFAPAGAGTGRKAAGNSAGDWSG